jgi:hypothetical protein
MGGLIHEKNVRIDHLPCDELSPARQLTNQAESRFGDDSAWLYFPYTRTMLMFLP